MDGSSGMSTASAGRIVAVSVLALWGLLWAISVPAGGEEPLSETQAPYLIVLGVAQDGGAPQAGTGEHPGWTDPSKRRHATSLALVDPADGRRWIFEATPDFREQLHRLDVLAPAVDADLPGLAGIFLTHAHAGHYTGLLHLGHEVMGTHEVLVWAMPRLIDYLRSNGPWSQLARLGNILLHPLSNGLEVNLGERLTVTPFLVPHRQEYSDVVGFRIAGPNRSVLFIPDIDSWEQWDDWGVRVEERIAEVDVAYLDGTFYAGGEIPGRDMSGFPHPMITHSMERFRSLPPSEKAKIRFIHLNHTNPALWPESSAVQTIEAAGFRVAVEGERLEL